MSEIAHPQPIGKFAGSAIQGIEQTGQLGAGRALVTIS
jgi:hypothetical protein